MLQMLLSFVAKEDNTIESNLKYYVGYDISLVLFFELMQSKVFFI